MIEKAPRVKRRRKKTGQHSHDYLSFQRRHPEAEVWLKAGLAPSGARALIQSGIHSPDDLKKQFREDLLKLRGLGGGQLRKCEALLGHELPSRADYWLANGIRSALARPLVQAGLRSIEDVAGMTREALLDIPYVGEVTVGHCERLLGRPLPSYQTYWIARGFRPRIAWKLSKAGLSNIRELVTMSRSELRKIGLTEEEITQCLS